MESCFSHEAAPDEAATGSCLLDAKLRSHTIGEHRKKLILTGTSSKQQAEFQSSIAPENTTVRSWWEEQSSQEFAHRSLGGYMKGKSAVLASWEQHFLKHFNWGGKRVLDYGIGGGYLGEALFSKYDLGSYVGVDISNKSLIAAQNTLSKEVAEGKVHLLLTPQSFGTLHPDILVCQAVIQHFPSVEYLDQFLANADSSGASEMMLQVRYGNATKADSAYDGAGVDEHKVMLALVTNGAYLQRKLSNYKLVWSDGPLNGNQYLFTGWRKGSD